MNNRKDLSVEEYLKNNLNIQILTDSGWSNFSGLIKKGVRPTLTIKTETKKLTTTPDHEFFTEGMIKISAKELTTKNKLITFDGTETITEINKDIIESCVYDLHNVENNKRFYANNLLVSNCEFLVFDETLINSISLSDLEGVEPIMKMGQCRWYKKVNPKMTYLVALDPSLGTGSDPSAIQVIELPTFNQVAEWHHNITPIQGQVRILRDICTFINQECANKGSQASLYYTVENNTVGEAALVALDELGEESIPGLFLSEPIKKGHVRRFRKGFNTTHSSKIAICAKLKHLIETKRMHLSSKPFISELKTYVAKGISFAAKTGANDDLVSSMLLAMRMAMVLQEWDPAVYDKMREDADDNWVAPLPIYINTF